jgi:excisionase family DNA binding protein
MTISADRVYTVPELRPETHAPRAMLYAALASGELRAVRRGRKWLIPGSAAIAWLEGLCAGPPK